MNISNGVLPSFLIGGICMVFLISFPANVLVSPIYDFLSMEDQRFTWTSTYSAYYFMMATMPIFASGLLFMKSATEKVVLRWIVLFFFYALGVTLYTLSNLLFPIFSLVSAAGATLVGIGFYVSLREGFFHPRNIFYAMSLACVCIASPMVLVHLDITRFADVSDKFGATSILYGFGNPRALGWSSTIFFTFLATYVSTQPKEERTHPILIFLLVICATTLFWSGSRGGAMSFTVSYILVCLISQTRNTKGILLVLLSIATACLISTFLYLPSDAYGIFERLNSTMARGNANAMSSGRLELWMHVISYLDERPLTGYGFFPRKNIEGFDFGSAHNFLLDYLLWFGWIAGTLMAVTTAWFWIIIAKFTRGADSKYVSALFCVITAFFLYSLVSVPYTRTFPLLLFGMCAGAILGLRAEKAKAQV